MKWPKPKTSRLLWKRLFEHDGPTLVNIYTNRDTLAMPPHITFEQMKGFATNIIKKIGQGDFAEAKDSIANSMKHIKDIFLIQLIKT